MWTYKDLESVIARYERPFWRKLYPKDRLIVGLARGFIVLTGQYETARKELARRGLRENEAADVQGRLDIARYKIRTLEAEIERMKIGAENCGAILPADFPPLEPFDPLCR